MHCAPGPQQCTGHPQTPRFPHTHKHTTTTTTTTKSRSPVPLSTPSLHLQAYMKEVRAKEKGGEPGSPKSPKKGSKKK